MALYDTLWIDARLATMAPAGAATAVRMRCRYSERLRARGVPYAILTRNTREEDFAEHRKMFLTGQGYSYAIRDEADLFEPEPMSEAG